MPRYKPENSCKGATIKRCLNCKLKECTGGAARFSHDELDIMKYVHNKAIDGSIHTSMALKKQQLNFNIK